MTESSAPHPNTGRHWLRWNGLLLLSLGALTCAAALGFQSTNWWSVFIFLPAVIFVLMAAISYGRPPRLSDWNVRVNLSLGAVVATVGLIFALGLNWRFAWTLMLMVPGLALLLNSLTRRPVGSAAFGWARFVGSIGLTLVALGLVFLGQQLGYYDLSERFGRFAWWGFFILAPGLVAIAGALAVFLRSTAAPGAIALRALGWLLLTNRVTRSGSIASASVLLALGAVFCAAAVGQFLGLHWAWQMPLPILAAGFALVVSAALSGR